jgi:starvation-inducible DNA-binding protein
MSNEREEQYSFSIDSNIPVTTKVQVIELLNHTLATTVDLKTQLKLASWNVTGRNSKPLQELFSEMAVELEEYIDICAERITDLGGLAVASVRVAAELSQLPEYPHNILDGYDHVTAVVQRLTVYAQSLQHGSVQIAERGDVDTSFLYMEVFWAIEQRLWLLQTHLQASAQENEIEVVQSSAITTSKEQTQALEFVVY